MCNHQNPEPVQNTILQDYRKTNQQQRTLALWCEQGHVFSAVQGPHHRSNRSCQLCASPRALGSRAPTNESNLTSLADTAVTASCRPSCMGLSCAWAPGRAPGQAPHKAPNLAPVLAPAWPRPAQVPAQLPERLLPVPCRQSVSETAPHSDCVDSELFASSVTLGC